MSAASETLVFLCALASGLSYCDRVNLSVAVVSMSEALHWSERDKATVLGSFFWGYLLSQMLGASLSKKYGGKWVLGYAAVFWSLLTLSAPFLAKTSLRLLIASRIGLGVFEGVTFPAIYYLLREYVHETQRSRAVATVSIGTICGAVLSFIVSPLLVERYGWEYVFFAFGGVVGPMFTVIWFRYCPTHNPNALPPAQVAAANEAAMQMSYLDMFKQPVLVSVFVAHFAHNLTHFSLMSYLPSFLHDALGFEGDSLAIASLPWIVMAVALLVSSSTADVIIMRGALPTPVVRRYFTTVSFVIAGASMFLVAWSVSNSQERRPMLTLFLLSIALAANGSSPAAGYEAAKLDLSKSATAASRLQSLSNTLATMAGIVGVPLVSFLKGDNDEWAPVFLGLGLSFFTAAVVFWTHGRWTGPII